jgi:hypothetical protein
MNETITQMGLAFVAWEHARLHVVAGWPESARKQALLAAIRSSVHRLMIDKGVASFRCMVCRTREPQTVVPFPPSRIPTSQLHGMAA